MTESASFTLKLRDQITRPARAASRAVADVRRSLRAVSAAARKPDRALLGLSSRLDEIAQRRGVFGGFRNRLRQALLSTANDGKSFTRVLAKSLGGEVVMGARSAASAIASIGTKVPWRKISSGLDAITSKLWGAAKGGAKLLGAVTAVGTFLVTRGVVGAAKFAEASKLALTNLTGSATAGRAAFKQGVQLARDYGLEVQGTVKQLIKLRAAQFSIPESLNIIKLTTDLRAIGATNEQVASSIRAIVQIASKGVLAQEELTGQLSEAGLSADLVYQALGKRLNKTKDQVQSLITARKIDARLGIAAIQDAILKKANIKQAGEAGKKFADSTLAGLIGRLKAAPGIKFLEIAESSSAVTPAVKNIVNELRQQIESIDPVRVGRFVENVLKAVKAAIPLVKAFGEGFGEGFDSLTKALETGKPTEKLKQDFKEFGKTVAKVIELGIKGMKLLGQATEFAVSPTGRLIGKVVAGVLAVNTLAKVVGGVVTAFKTLSKVSLGPLLSAVGRIGAALGITKGAAAAAGKGLGAAGLVVGAGAAGYAVGTRVDKATGASRGLQRWLEDVTGLTDELNAQGARTPFRGINGAIGPAQEASASAKAVRHALLSMGTGPFGGALPLTSLAAPKSTTAKLPGLQVGEVNISLGTAGSAAEAREMGEAAGDGFMSRLGRLTDGAAPAGL